MSEICIDTGKAVDVDVAATGVDVEVSINPPIQVDVIIGGPPGPPGPEGPVIGEATAKRYVHTQAMPSPTWIVTHNLACHPLVFLEDAVGNVLHGSISYIDENMLAVGFAYSITGHANCI